MASGVDSGEDSGEESGGDTGPAAPAVFPEGMLPVEGRSQGGASYRFCMDRTEVTVAAYRACPICSAPDSDEYCNWSVLGRDNHPVNCVDAFQADDYCAWRGGRLPTDQQWQFAAQGPDGRTYPWGDSAASNQLCWNRWSSQAGTCEVGSFEAGRSPFGLEDMSGNVWEWTSTVSTASDRASRGGSWKDDHPASVRASYRQWSIPHRRYYDVGFRCRRDAY